MKILQQVWHMVCRDRLFSAIYIGGTALALATVTIGAVMIYNKVAPVYPEYQRTRTAYMSSAGVHLPNGYFYQSALSYESFRDYFSSLENATDVALCKSATASYAQPADGGLSVQLLSQPVDTAFFRIFSYDFLAGAPFTQADFDSGLHRIVITDRTARRIYGTSDYGSLLGRKFSLDFTDYTVCGIVREASPVGVFSFGHVFFPFTSIPGYDRDSQSSLHFLGDYNMVFLTDDVEALRAEVRDIQDRFNSSHDELQVDFLNQPTPHFYFAITGEPYESAGDTDLSSSLWTLIFYVLVLLLVPALNLSGIISGRMEGRVAEMGVRKAFGAGRGRLMMRVLWENLFLTLAGGIVGFLIACVALRAGVLGLFTTSELDEPVGVSGETMFAPAVFGFAFLVCCLLNLMSAMLPAWRSLRKPIVESLKA